MVAVYSSSRPASIDTKAPTSLHTPPFASHSLHQQERATLQQMARKNSEKFARKIMQAAIELDSSEHGIEAACQNAGIEFVSSINGIDVYEDMCEKKTINLNDIDTPNYIGTTQKSTQLRSLCHIETDIHEFVKRMTVTSRPPLLPGIIDRHELCTVLETPDHQVKILQRPLSPLEIEHAGIHWFALNQESIQSDSTLRNCRNKNNQQQHELHPNEVDGFDYVVLSYQGVFKHRERRGWMQWCQSVNVPFYPPLHPSSRYTRGHLLSSGIVAVESATRPGQMSVSFVMGADL